MITLQNRVSLHLLIMNSDVNRFNTVFNSANARYILLAISLLFSILIFVGRLTEVNQMVLSDNRIIEIVILIKVIYWIVKFIGR